MKDFVVLGLLGPAGSGKDTVADWFVRNENFAKVSFADPMKRFAANAFHLTVDQLWGPSEARNAEFSVDEPYWFDVISHFSTASLEIINDVLETGVRTQGYLALHDWLTNLRKNYRERISTRVILQTLGTEWGRAVDPMMWARYAHKIAATLKEGSAYYSRTTGLFYSETDDDSNYQGVVIPDHRFENEVRMTQEQGGYVLRIRRLELEKKDETVGVVGHQSEAEQKTLPDSAFDNVLEFEEGLDKMDEKLAQVTAEEAWKMRHRANRS